LVARLLLLSNSLIGKLLIGYLDTGGGDQDSDEDYEGSSGSYLPQKISTNDGFAIPAPREKR
jgi:hypothetical protein